MKNVKKLAIAGVLTAVAVVCSPLSIPMGIAKCFPVQHMVNVIAGVILGPAYAVGMAFVTSLIRVLTGTGTLLAFPGSMVGALCAGLAYKYTSKLTFTYFGEVIGTGVLGALLAYPMATLIMGKDVAWYGFVIPFLVSTVVGALISVMVLQTFKTTGLLKKFKMSGGA